MQVILPQRWKSWYCGLAVAVLCVTVAGLVAYHLIPGHVPDREEGAQETLRLYFSDQEGAFLEAEERMLTLPDSPAERARRIVGALIEGPRGHMTPTIPDGTAVLSVNTTEDGTAYVDFSRRLSENHPGGTRSELLTIFSIVNTLALNMPQVQVVQILIEGQVARTLAGHIDIRSPLQPDMYMIKRPVGS